MVRTTLAFGHWILFGILSLVAPMPAVALEPGLLRNEELFKERRAQEMRGQEKPAAEESRGAPPAVAAPGRTRRGVMPGPVNMMDEFTRAKGLTENQLRDMHYSRVGCARRMYSRNGYSVEGDADVKATAVSDDLYEVEFPSRIYLKRFDPYQSGIQEIESEVSLQLIRFAHWVRGAPLKLRKKVRLVFVDPNRRDQLVTAVDEVRLLENAYPPRYVIRETIFSDGGELDYYFICQ